MRAPAITIKHISSLSGYSTSTVSKALNNKLEISKSTRKRIQSIAKRHNYIPNNYAVSLRTQKTGSLAVIVPEITKSCYSHSLGHIQKSAEKLGYRILFYQTFYCDNREMNYIKSLSDGSIDGIILVWSEDKKKQTEHKNTNLPVETIHINCSQTIDEIKQLSYASLINVLKV